MRALVTGAARGLGASIVSRLLDDGWSVLAVDVETCDASSPVGTQRGRRDGVVEVQADVSDPEAVDRAVGVAADHFGGLDLVVNNAGIGGPALPLVDSPVPELRRVLDVNLLGPMVVIRATVGLLRDSDRACIVNMGSLFGRLPVADDAAYCASKGGIAALTRALARELAPEIRVNGIEPGLMDTEMHWQDVRSRAHRTGIALEEAAAEEAAGIPLKRHGTGADVAATVAWLASSEAGYVTGQMIAVDGGVVVG